jgi:hypothetical protein
MQPTLNQISKSADMPPWLTDTGHWVPIPDACAYFQRGREQIRKWCLDGTFAAAKIPVYQDRKRQWWIRLPD